MLVRAGRIGWQGMIWQAREMGISDKDTAFMPGAWQPSRQGSTGQWCLDDIYAHDKFMLQQLASLQQKK
jgi:hypothetical protein